MEIHQRPDSVKSAKEAARIKGQLQSDITRPNRESIREVTETLRLEKADRIELSTTAERITAEQDAEASERTERLEALRSAIQAGTLNDPARVERAARELLGGE